MNKENKDLTVTRQCELLGINRGKFYHKPKDNPRELLIMPCMDEIYTKDSTIGQRGFKRALKRRYGLMVGRSKICTLMKKMNIHAIYPKPNLSFPRKDDFMFPYLLRGVTIDHVNQVWSTDITYIRLEHGFVYLTAVIDWYSRMILSWRVSNTLSSHFCIEAVQEAMEKYGRPEIFNTDQGCQYTSNAFVSLFEERDENGNLKTKLSMDSKGRAYDNIYIERFWRTIKYNDIYIKNYSGVKDCIDGISRFMEYYNHEKEHSSLDGNPPADIYFGKAVLKEKAA